MHIESIMKVNKLMYKLQTFHFSFCFLIYFCFICEMKSSEIRKDYLNNLIRKKNYAHKIFQLR